MFHSLHLWVPVLAFLGAVGLASIALTVDREHVPATVAATEPAPAAAGAGAAAGAEPQLVLDTAAPAAAVARPSGVLTYLSGDGGFVAVDVADPTSAPELIEGASAGPPAQTDGGSYPSPDGRYVATVRRDETGVAIDVREDERQVTTMQIAGPDDPELLAGTKGQAAALDGVPLTIAWSPDSRYLAYGSITSEPFSLAVVRTDIWSTLYRTVAGGYVGELAWAPDSSRLAISTYELDRSDHTVLIFDPRRSTVRPLIDGCAIVWSPDARFLAVHREPSVASGVWLTTPDGETRIEVTAEVLAFPLRWDERAS